MRAVIQRVTSCSVSVQQNTVGKIDSGIVIFLGITHDDGLADSEYIASKSVNLRIFPDEDGVMNRSVLDVGGDVMVISQFTLYGDTKRGRRPSYAKAAGPETAVPLYEHFILCVKKTGLKTESGVFGAHMDVSYVNHGPITLIVDSKAR